MEIETKKTLVYWAVLCALICSALIIGSYVGLLILGDDAAHYVSLACGGGVICYKDKIKKWVFDWPAWKE
jgi:hypothetical protein